MIAEWHHPLALFFTVAKGPKMTAVFGSVFEQSFGDEWMFPGCRGDARL